jgi:hypothetical protein
MHFIFFWWFPGQKISETRITRMKRRKKITVLVGLYSKTAKT